jgi:hypothetical protein
MSRDCDRSSRRILPQLTFLAVSLAVIGCGSNERGTVTSASGGNDGVDADAGDGDGDADADAGDDATGGDDTILDVGGDGDADAGDDGSLAGCEKVDFLFVLDNSVSILDEISNLTGSFPGFVDGIENTLTANDWHVGVVSSEEFENNQVGCREYGALVTETVGAGTGSSDTVCGPFAEGRYLTKADDLATDFECIARLGADAFDERPMQSIVAAVDGSLAGPGGCNEGFLRDDALLVIVIVTDEEDDWEYFDPGDNDKWQGSDGNPPDWIAAVTAAKLGKPENAVVVAIVGGAPNSVCPREFDGVNGAQDAVRIKQFAQAFPNHFIGDVCADSYVPVFEQALGVIDTACDEFVPPG